jgi:xanthine dehydrogenase accessory factor
MIGSTRKIDLLKKRFLEEKILTRGEIEKIDMPIGIKFNAQTPQEIAISIMAKLIDVRNTRNNNNR